MKRLILLCSNVSVAAIADYISRTFQQDADMPGLLVLWQGKTARHDIGLIIIEGREIPERLLDMIAISRDLFDFTGVFEDVSSPTTSDAAGRTMGVHDI